MQLTFRRWTANLAVAALLPLLVASVGAADQHPAAANDEPTAEQFVEQLGAAEFAQRRQAVRRLLQLGTAARPALQAGMKHDDLEIRLESHRILVQVMQNEFDTRITAFLNGTSESVAAELPGWRLFCENVSSDRNARELYAEMLRAESDLLFALERRDKTAGQLCANRVQALISSTVMINGRRETIPAATLATVLFVGSHLQDPAMRSMPVNLLTSRIYSILCFPATQQSMCQETHAILLQQLLGGWIRTICASSETYNHVYALQLVLKYDLQELGPPLARKVLRDAHVATSAVPFAAIVLARFGRPDDAELLLPHLKNEEVFHTWSNPQLKKEPIRIQVRDVVLAVLIHVSGEDPHSFGFKLLEPFPETLYRIWTFGFLEDSQREEALAKWRSRTTRTSDGLSAQDKKPPEGDTPAGDKGPGDKGPGDKGPGDKGPGEKDASR